MGVLEAREMKAVRALLMALMIVACGGGGSSGGQRADASGSGGSGGLGDSGTTACGTELACDAGAVCIVDERSAACEAKPEDAGSCPPGKAENLCGGIGYACCCDPPPPNEYRCEPATGCAGDPDCSCLGDVCKGRMCLGVSGKDREFHCVDRPMP
jgi:hypothetical protein